MLSRIHKVRDALLTVSPNVGHYRALHKTDCYLVWAEDGEGDSLYTDNGKGIQVIQGTIDYFTKTESDPAVEQIQEALKQAGIPYEMSSVQYEDETGYKHWEWVWEV